MILNFLKSPHMWHIRNNIARFRRNFSIRNEKYKNGIVDLFLETFVKTFLTYLPRPFLYFNFFNNKKTKVDVNELRQNGYMKLSYLDNDLIDYFINIFLNKSSQIYNSNFQNIDQANEYFIKNNIQRSKPIYLDLKDKKYLEFLKNYYISDIATNYLKENPNKLQITSYIFMLSKINYQNEKKELGLQFPSNINTELEKIKYSVDSKHALHFHRDIDHYKFIKFFYYLTDCFDGNGQHMYITKSHKIIKMATAPYKRYLEEELINSYKDSKFLNLIGKKGFGFAEDTFGFHRGTPITNKYRIMMMTQIKPFGGRSYNFIPLKEIINFN
tara:strand:- start:662 stop:1645 length:984 start_codon:yes stop_codon:yes gene_type:complete